MRNRLGYVGKLQESGHGIQEEGVKKRTQWGKKCSKKCTGLLSQVASETVREWIFPPLHCSFRKTVEWCEKWTELQF
jgi:hypothetical protein